MARLDLKGVCNFLLSHDDYLILTHKCPDGDTLGAAYALAAGLLSLNKNASVVCGDDIPEVYSYFTDKVVFPEFEPETVVSVDVADAKLLGSYENMADKIELSIDHHASCREFAKNLYLDSVSAAACECMYDILTALRVEITGVIAEALYTGIATDTGCFKFSNTSPKTHVVAAKLMDCNIDCAEINRIMFDTKSRGRIEIEKLAQQSMEFFCDGQVALMCVTQKMIKKSGCAPDDLEGLTAIPRSVEGVKIGITVRQREARKYKISLRSYPPVDVSVICAKMQGGGHKYAAGCELTGSLRQVKAEILKHVKAALED